MRMYLNNNLQEVIAIYIYIYIINILIIYIKKAKRVNYGYYIYIYIIFYKLLYRGLYITYIINITY